VITENEKIAMVHSISFGNRFCDCPTLVDSRNWHTALQWVIIPAIDRIAASLFPLSADWLATITYLQQLPQ
jgi:hypothetical protein